MTENTNEVYYKISANTITGMISYMLPEENCLGDLYQHPLIIGISKNRMNTTAEQPDTKCRYFIDVQVYEDTSYIYEQFPFFMAKICKQISSELGRLHVLYVANICDRELFLSDIAGKVNYTDLDGFYVSEIEKTEIAEQAKPVQVCLWDASLVDYTLFSDEVIYPGFMIMGGIVLNVTEDRIQSILCALPRF